jgi:hypothetical protein
MQSSDNICLQYVEHRIEPADGPALRPDGPRSGQSMPGGRTVRACTEQIRVPSFMLRLLAKITGKARKLVCKGVQPPSSINREVYGRFVIINRINTTSISHFILRVVLV